jgi:hypothetical protein
MAITRASKKRLAICAVVLALGGGTLTASAEACYRGGYGWRAAAAYPAAAGYGYRGYGWRDADWGWRGAGWGWRGVGWRRGWGWRDGGLGWRGVGWRGGGWGWRGVGFRGGFRR